MEQECEYHHWKNKLPFPLVVQIINFHALIENDVDLFYANQFWILTTIFLLKEREREILVKRNSVRGNHITMIKKVFCHVME